MNTKKRIIIVGAGFAGVKTALELMGDERFEVLLISPHGRFEYHGAMYRSATGRSPLEVVVPLSEIFANATNIEVVLDSVVKLLPDRNELEGETGQKYEYDTLVMAVGYVVNYFNIEGMALYSENMYSITSAIKLRHRLVDAVRSHTAENELNIVVAGAGPTGIEIAANIKNFAKIIEGKHGLSHVPIQVHLIEASDRLLPGLSQTSSDIALQRLNELNIGVHRNTRVTKCSASSIETDRGEIPSDITIWTAGNMANPIFTSYPELFTLTERGRVSVNEFFQANHDNVYVLGDAADTEYSGMAQTAIHNAIALARNLQRQAKGEDMGVYEPKQPAYVVPIGGDWALLETESDIKTGDEGWAARRDADIWVLDNFLPHKLANEHFEHGERIANF